MKKNLLLLLFLQALSTLLPAQFDPVVESISAFNQKFPEEMTYLHMDREVYNPGDTLWFKAYVRHKVTLKKNTLSKTLFVKVLNNRGQPVHESIHPVFNSETVGQIEIEEGLNSGMYELICYSSWMKNGNYENVYRKSFRIQEESTGRESFSFSFDREHYSEGDTILAYVSFLDKYESELTDVKIKFSTPRTPETFQKGNFNPDTSKYIQLLVNPSLKSAPELSLSTTYKGYYFDTIVKLPILGEMALDFFPEGGTLLAGHSNRMAFQVQTESGIPLDIEGMLYNKNGDQIGKIRSDHLGMGSFMFIPEEGESYYVKISEPGYTEKKFFLPEAAQEGWLLQASSNHQNLVVTINHTWPFSKPALVTLSIRDFLLKYAVRQVKGFDTFSIPTGDLPPGIAVLTLFDENLLPRAERLVFVNADKSNRVEMEADRSSYLPRDSVQLKIRVRDFQNRPVSGSFSLSVVDEQLCMSSSINEPDIRSSSYLSSEVKGFIHQPDSYFDSEDPDASYHLDLLLLTQGWRQYRYEAMLEHPVDSLAAPKIYDVVSGQLFRYRYGREGVPSKGIIQVFNSGGTAEFETDEEGRFRYMHIYHPTKNPNVVLFGNGPSGKEKMEIFLDPDAFEDQFEAYFSSHADSLFRRPYQQPELSINFEDQYTLGINNKWIEEVTVYGKRQQKIDFVEETFINSDDIAEGVIASAPDVLGVLLNRGLPVREELDTNHNEYLYYEAYPRGPIHWYVDDFQRDYSFVKGLWTGDIKAMFVVKFPDTQMFEIPDREVGADLSSVIISIHTVPFSERPDRQKRNNTVILPKLSMSKDFYKPRYDTEARRYSQVPDLRKTIHWEPRVELDENGEAIISYYNGDRYTRVVCILEGMSGEGIPTFGKSAYHIYTVRE